jgi:hypothetical protein
VAAPPSHNTSLRVGHESGYVLITAIWLLILAGAIASVLMLWSLNATKSANNQSAALADKILLESAVETVFAERLFDGNRSQWWRTPAFGRVVIDNRTVEVSVTSESGRLDINEADLKLIGRALAGLGVPSTVRTRALVGLQIGRGNNRPITSFADIRALLGVDLSSNNCVEENVTFVSGLPTPRPDQLPPSLARALGQPSLQDTSVPEPGAALRVVVRINRGAGLLVVARITGLQGNPIAISSWDYAPSCAQSN